MSLDINSLSIIELERLKQEANTLIEAKKEQSLDEAYSRIVQFAQGVGLTLEELVAWGAKKTDQPVRKSVKPRYQNPDNPNETWTGRGKQPRWLADKIKAGAKPEDFLIQ